MAYPIVNSPFLPSVNDAPFLPPKLKDMPAFNPGTRCYECDDGTVRYMSENEAINHGACRVVDDSRCAGARRPPAPIVTGYTIPRMGQTFGISRFSPFNL